MQQPKRPFTTSSLTSTLKSTFANQPLLSNLTNIDKLSSQATSLAQKTPFFNSNSNNNANQQTNNGTSLQTVTNDTPNINMMRQQHGNPGPSVSQLGSNAQQPMSGPNQPAVDMSHLTEEERLMIQSVMAKAEMADMGIPVDTSTPSSTNLPSNTSQALTQQRQHQIDQQRQQQLNQRTAFGPNVPSQSMNNQNVGSLAGQGSRDGMLSMGGANHNQQQAQQQNIGPTQMNDSSSQSAAHSDFNNRSPLPLLEQQTQQLVSQINSQFNLGGQSQANQQQVTRQQQPTNQHNTFDQTRQMAIDPMHNKNNNMQQQQQQLYQMNTGPSNQAISMTVDSGRKDNIQPQNFQQYHQGGMNVNRMAANQLDQANQSILTMQGQQMNQFGPMNSDQFSLYNDPNQQHQQNLQQSQLQTLNTPMGQVVPQTTTQSDMGAVPNNVSQMMINQLQQQQQQQQTTGFNMEQQPWTNQPMTGDTNEYFMQPQQDQQSMLMLMPQVPSNVQIINARQPSSMQSNYHPMSPGGSKIVQSQAQGQGQAVYTDIDNDYRARIMNIYEDQDCDMRATDSKRQQQSRVTDRKQIRRRLADSTSIDDSVIDSRHRGRVARKNTAQFRSKVTNEYNRNSSFEDESCENNGKRLQAYDLADQRRSPTPRKNLPRNQGLSARQLPQKPDNGPQQHTNVQKSSKSLAEPREPRMHTVRRVKASPVVKKSEKGARRRDIDELEENVNDEESIDEEYDEEIDESTTIIDEDEEYSLEEINRERAKAKSPRDENSAVKPDAKVQRLERNSRNSESNDSESGRKVGDESSANMSDQALKLLQELKLTEKANLMMEQQNMLIKQSQELIRLQQEQLEKQAHSSKTGQEKKNGELDKTQTKSEADKSKNDLHNSEPQGDDQKSISSTHSQPTGVRLSELESEEDLSRQKIQSESNRTKNRNRGNHLIEETIDDKSPARKHMTDADSSSGRRRGNQLDDDSGRKGCSPRLPSAVQRADCVPSPTDTTDSDADLISQSHRLRKQQQRLNSPSSGSVAKGLPRLNRRREPTGLPPSPLPVAAAIQLHQLQQQHMQTQQQQQQQRSQSSAINRYMLRSRSEASSPTNIHERATHDHTQSNSFGSSLYQKYSSILSERFSRPTSPDTMSEYGGLRRRRRRLPEPPSNAVPITPSMVRKMVQAHKAAAAAGGGSLAGNLHSIGDRILNSVNAQSTMVSNAHGAIGGKNLATDLASGSSERRQTTNDRPSRLPSGLGMSNFGQNMNQRKTTRFKESSDLWKNPTSNSDIERELNTLLPSSGHSILKLPTGGITDIKETPELDKLIGTIDEHFNLNKNKTSTPTLDQYQLKRDEYHSITNSPLTHRFSRNVPSYDVRYSMTRRNSEGERSYEPLSRSLGCTTISQTDNLRYNPRNYNQSMETPHMHNYGGPVTQRSSYTPHDQLNSSSLHHWSNLYQCGTTNDSNPATTRPIATFDSTRVLREFQPAHGNYSLSHSHRARQSSSLADARSYTVDYSHNNSTASIRHYPPGTSYDFQQRANEQHFQPSQRYTLFDGRHPPSSNYSTKLNYHDNLSRHNHLTMQHQRSLDLDTRSYQPNDPFADRGQGYLPAAQLGENSTFAHPNLEPGSGFAPLTKSDIINNGPKFQSIGYRFRTENQNKYVPAQRALVDCNQTRYPSPYNRILLSKNPKDRIGNGIGVKIIGGQPLPNLYDKVNRCIVTSGSFVTEVFQTSNVYLMNEIHKGDQIIEWNGVNLCNRSNEEVQQILLSQFSDDEVEIVYLNRDKFYEAYGSVGQQSDARRDTQYSAQDILRDDQKSRQVYPSKLVYEDTENETDPNDPFEVFSRLHNRGGTGRPPDANEDFEHVIGANSGGSNSHKSGGIYNKLSISSLWPK